MKVWRASYHDPDEGCVVSWHPSKKDADAVIREAKKELLARDDDGEPCKVAEVDIPTDRLGLIHWLNQNLSRDNG